jgi:hypothetical protein
VQAVGLQRAALAHLHPALAPLAAGHLVARLLTHPLAALAEVLLDRARRPPERLRTVLAVCVLVLGALLGAGPGGLLERLEDRLGVPGPPGEQRQDGLAEFDDVLAEPDALDHVRVRLLDALVGTEPTDLDAVDDGVEGCPLLGRLDVLEAHPRPLSARHLLASGHLLAAAHLLATGHLLAAARLKITTDLPALSARLLASAARQLAPTRPPAATRLPDPLCRLVFLLVHVVCHGWFQAPRPRSIAPGGK